MIRLLFIAIAIMMGGLMAVLYAIVYKVSNRPKKTEAPAAIEQGETSGDLDANLGLPEGSRIISQAIDGRRMSVLAVTPDGRQTIFVFDLVEGRQTGRIDISR